MKKNIIPIAIIVAGLLIAGALVYVNYQKCPGKTSIEGQILSSQEAAEKVIDFINQNVLRGKATASLTETIEENGLYKIKFVIEGQEIESYVTLDGKLLFPEAIDLSEIQEGPAEEGFTIGDFTVSDEEVCKENGKPIVYFFGSEGCPHCAWERPIIEKVAEKFKGYITFHNNTGTEDDMDVFQKYSTGGVPTLVLGCKYYRVGSGERAGEEEENRTLTALICKLTENEPKDICDEVKDLVEQINN